MKNIKTIIDNIIEEEIATVRGSWMWGRTRNGGNEKKPKNYLDNNEEYKNIIFNLEKEISGNHDN